MPIFRKLTKKEKQAYIYLIPAFIMMLIIFAYPIIEAFIQSFYQWNPLQSGFEKDLIFFNNYKDIFNDPLFYKTLLNTLYLTVGAVGIEFFLGFLIALIIFEEITLKSFSKTAVIIPMMMAPTLVALIWKMFLDHDFGLFNHILRLLNIHPVNWLGSTKMVMPTIMMVDIWQNTSFVILVLLAGLQAIPVEQFEAADVDGASRFQKLIYIIIPWLRPLIFIVLIFRVLFVFRTFDTVYMLLGSAGGVGNSAMVFGIYLYHKAFSLFNIGLASAISIIMLIITFTLSISFTIMLYKNLKI